MEDIQPGTLMVITGKSNDHEFHIGETVRVVQSWKSDEYQCEHLDGSDYWYVKVSDMMHVPSNKKEAYLCLTDDGYYIAHEGSLETIPYYVTAVWKPGEQLVRKTTWSEV
jgi:hypothetical protein